jgi:hypothetical protein
MTTILSAAVGVLLILTAYLWRRNRQLASALEPLSEQLQLALEESLRHLHAAKAAKEREERYLTKVIEAQTERDGWFRLHNEESIGHSGAQAMMLSLIQRLATQLQAKGVDPKIPPIIQQVAADHEVNFAAPARERVKKPETPPEPAS